MVWILKFSIPKYICLNFHRPPPSLTMLECPSFFFANLLTLIFRGEDNYCPSTLVFYLLIFKLYVKILSHIFVVISWSFISKYIFQRLCKMLSSSLASNISNFSNVHALAFSIFRQTVDRIHKILTFVGKTKRYIRN